MNPFKGLELNIQLVEQDAKMPTRGHKHDAGCDVYSTVDYIINPGETVNIPLGWRMEMPNGYAMIFKEKSSIGTNKKLSLRSGVIDSEYRGITTVTLTSHNHEPVVLPKHSKIAQFMVVPVWYGIPKQVDYIDTESTARGEGGFGSTGSF